MSLCAVSVGARLVNEKKEKKNSRGSGGAQETSPYPCPLLFFLSVFFFLLFMVTHVIMHAPCKSRPPNTYTTIQIHNIP